jgi:hypothetical protein
VFINMASPGDGVAVSLPYRFDTSAVWRKILAGAFGLNALILLGILYSTLVSRHWTTARWTASPPCAWSFGRVP